MSLHLLIATSVIAAPSDGARNPAGEYSPEARRNYNLPRGDAATTLQQLAIQSGQPVFFLVDKVRGEQTNAIDGDFSLPDALAQMLSDTGLTAYRDDSTGGFVVIRRSSLLPHPEVGTLTNTQPQKQMKKHTKVVAWVLALFGWTATNQLPAQTVTDSSPTSVEESKEQEREDSVKKLEEGKILELPAYQVTSTAQKGKILRNFEIAIPVTTLSAITLVESNQLRLQDYASRIPGLSVTPTDGGAFQQVVLRGLNSGGQGNAAVGFTIDDIPLGAPNRAAGAGAVPDLDPGDLAQVEVLRGPQGTLYGATSLGGLIKYVTTDPSMSGYSGSLRFGATGMVNGSELGYHLRGRINVPLGSSLAVSVSGFTRLEPGYIDNDADGREGLNEQNVQGGYLSVLWRPVVDWSVKLGFLVQRHETEGSNQVSLAFGEFQQRLPKGIGQFDSNYKIYSANVKGKLGNLSLTSVSAYSVKEGVIVGDGSGLAFLFGPTNNVPTVAAITYPLDDRRYSQELRLEIPISDRADILVGGFYTYEDTDSDVRAYGVDASSGANILNGYNYDSFGNFIYEEYAAFASLNIRLTDRWDIQFGGRKSWIYQATSGGSGESIFANPGTYVTNTVEKFSGESNSFTYLVTPRFKMSNDVMIYARLASGYRIGGVNEAACKIFNFPCGYGPDTSLNYEIGAKGDFLDHRFSVDTSVYHIDWKDIQLLRSSSTTGLGYFDNGGKATSQGVELAAEYRFPSKLSIAGTLAWNRTAVTEKSELGNKDDHLPFAPSWSGRMSVRQEFSVERLGVVFMEGSAVYVGERGGFVGSIGPSNFPDYVNYDFNAGVRSSSGWSANLSVRNVTDERGSSMGNPITGTVIYIQPRTVGVNISREF